MTKILNFALKIKGGGREGGTCEVLRPCHPLKIWNVHLLVSTPWCQSLCITFVFLHVRSNYLLKTEEISFQAKVCPNFAALPSLKLGLFFKF